MEKSPLGGHGLERLHEGVLRLARQLVRQGTSLAYGGGWKDTEDNLTYDFLRLLSTEQKDPEVNSDSATAATYSRALGRRLYNHCSWPYHLEASPELETQWSKYCWIVRISQQQAGLREDEILPDAAAANPSPRLSFNSAVVLGAMRRLMLDEIRVQVAGVPEESVASVSAWVALGGKVQGYAGFMPGIFEEALAVLEKGRPLFLLGGFGGAAELLAQAIFRIEAPRPAELTVGWHELNSEGFRELSKLTQQFRLPAPLPTIPAAFDRLWSFVEAARRAPAAVLHTGLTDDATRQLLTTREAETAERLVVDGLARTCLSGASRSTA